MVQPPTNCLPLKVCGRIERQGHHSNLFISNFLTYNSQSLWCEIRRSEFGTRNPLTFQMVKYEFHHLFLLKNLIVSRCKARHESNGSRTQEMQSATVVLCVHSHTVWTHQQCKNTGQFRIHCIFNEEYPKHPKRPFKESCERVTCGATSTLKSIFCQPHCFQKRKGAVRMDQSNLDQPMVPIVYGDGFVVYYPMQTAK